MKAIIAAAGEGRRMLPLTKHLPKPMLEVLGQPLLAHIILSLPKEIDELIIVVGYKQEAIREYFGDEFDGRKITYITQETKAGTADAVRRCKPHLDEGERFLLSWADDLYDHDSIARCLSHDYSLLIAEAEDPRRYGVVTLSDDGTVIDIEEKPEHPRSNLVAPGIYVLDTKVFSYDSRVIGDEDHFIPMLQQFIRDHSVHTERASFWATIAFPEDLDKAAELLKERRA